MFNPHEVESLIEQAMAHIPPERSMLKALLPAFIRQLSIEFAKAENRDQALDLVQEIGEAFASLAHNATISILNSETPETFPIVAQATRNTFISSFTFSYLSYLDEGPQRLMKVNQVKVPEGVKPQ